MLFLYCFSLSATAHLHLYHSVLTGGFQRPLPPKFAPPKGSSYLFLLPAVGEGRFA